MASASRVFGNSWQTQPRTILSTTRNGIRLGLPRRSTMICCATRGSRLPRPRATATDRRQSQKLFCRDPTSRRGSSYWQFRPRQCLSAIGVTADKSGFCPRIVCLLLTQSGHASAAGQCPLAGCKADIGPLVGECRRAQRMEAELDMPELLWSSRRRCLSTNYNPGIPRLSPTCDLGVPRLPVPLSWEPRNSQNIER